MEETQQMQGGSSSSGSGEGKHELSWKAYAKEEAKRKINGCDCECIPVMVSLSGVREKTGKQRSPMDVVVVLHVRRGKDYINGPKNWRALLKEAMDTIAAGLRDDEDRHRLAVVPGASALTPAQRFLTPQLITSETSLVRALEHAESILLGREHEEKMRRAGHIIVISNSNEDDMCSLLVPYRLRYVRHAFGFRDAHNARTMQSLCTSIRNCTYAVLDDEQGQIAPAFFDSIDRTITSAVAAMPTEVKLKCDQKVLIAAIDTPGVRHFISYDKKVGVVWPPAHRTAQPFKFVVYLGNLALRGSDDDLLKLFSIQAKYRGGDSGGDVPSPPADKVAVQVVTSKNNVDESKEVAAEMVRTKAVKIVADILAQDKTDWEQLHGAAESLRGQWEQLKETECYGEAGDLISGLSADMYEMEIRLRNNYFWQEYMLSWHSHQRWQLPIRWPFMDKQPTSRKHDLLVVDPVVVPSPHAAARGRSGLVPVLVRVMAPEVGLAMVKRASVDLVVIVDAGYGAKEMEEKLETRQKLLSMTKELEEQRNNAIKTLVEYQNKLDVLIYGKKVGGFSKRWQQDAGGTIQQLIIPVSRRRVDPDNETREMQRAIDQKRKEMNVLAKKIKTKLAEAEEMDQEFERVTYKARKRLDVITKAIELVQKKLSVEDRLAIICAQFPDIEPAAAGLLEMSTQGQRQTTAKLQKLMGKLELSEASWKTPAENKPKLSKASDYREQSKKAMKLMRTCLYCTLSSMPIPMSAECHNRASMTVNSGGAGGSTLLSKALIHAVKILDERREQENMGFIVVVSDRDDDSICGEILSPKYITHAFGFHETHNMWAMYHIACSSNGIYDILNDESNKLTEAFVACINKITSTIAVDTEIDIKCSHSSVVASAIESSSGLFVASSPSIGDSGKSCSIKAGTLSAGTVASFIINMDQVREDELFTLHMKWVDPSSGKTKEKPEDEVVVVSKGGDGIDRSKGEGVIMESSARVAAVKTVNEIAAPLYQDRTMVEANLKQRCKKCSRDAKTAREDRLASAMAMMAANLYMETGNPGYFKQLVAQTLSYMLSWLSYHRSSQQAT